MEVVEEENPLQIFVDSNSTLINNEEKTKNFNSAGRPRRRNEIKFTPQPKSIVSQLLNKEKFKRKITLISVRSEEILPDNGPSEDNTEPDPKDNTNINDSKTHNCDHPSCDYTSTSSSNLIKHKRRHTSEKPYMCDQCTFRTNFVNSLTVHKRIHSGERPYACAHCNYRCNSSSNLKKHCMHKHSSVS